jgi:hypothetical protein
MSPAFIAVIFGTADTVFSCSAKWRVSEGRTSLELRISQKSLGFGLARTENGNDAHMRKSVRKSTTAHFMLIVTTESCK